MTELPAGRPTLVGEWAAGSGKTTLAHRLAAAIGCPALCRDAIKEGMVAATPAFLPGPSDPLTVRTYSLFFAAIRLFLEHGVTHVAEAAFQHANWARGLEPLRPLAELRIVRCRVAPAIARARAEQRGRAAHPSCTRRLRPLQRGTAIRANPPRCTHHRRRHHQWLQP